MVPAPQDGDHFFRKEWRAMAAKLKAFFGHTLGWLRRDPVLAASMLLALVSAFFVPPSAEYVTYPDWGVLALLLALMLVVAGLKATGVFLTLTNKLLGHIHHTRTLCIGLTMVCFFTSMLITNDVALITFAPLSVLLLEQAGQRRLLIPVIVLETIAANLGSMLTPIGNPQNLYLYSLSGMSAPHFLRLMILPTVCAFLLLLVSCICVKGEPLTGNCATQSPSALPWPRIILWCVLFVLCLLTVAKVLHFAVSLAAVLAAVLVVDRKLLRGADYNLLLTFLFFFIFVGNIKQLPAVSGWLSGLIEGHELTAGILLSQVISNVPAAMLLSGFTDQYAHLILGVNLGGLGTLIASMASLISYKAYSAAKEARVGRYLAVFTGVNLVFLAILWAVTVLLLPWIG